MIKRLVLCVGCIMTLILGKLEVNAMTKDSKQLSEYFNNGAPITTQVGAYNTYVGARYVPIFCGEWDANNTYEPLSIVTYEGNSYTSRGYVPKGAQITNDTYWVLTGNFNGQIASIQEEVNKNTTNINSNTESIEIINSTLTTNQPYINKLIPDNRFYVFIGDSYGTKYGNVTTPWPELVASNLGLDENHYVNLSVGGRGFNGIPESNNVINGYTEWVNANPNLSNKVTHIIIALGINDGSYTTGLLAKVKSQLGQIKVISKQAEIMLFMIGNMDNNNETPPKLDNIYIEASFESGVKSIPELYYCWFTNNGFDSSHYHPTQLGQAFLGYTLSQAIISNQKFIYPIAYDLEFTPSNSGDTISLTQYIRTNAVVITGKINCANLEAGTIATTDVLPVGRLWLASSSKGMFQIVNNNLKYLGNETGPINEPVIFIMQNLL